jgi:hypothetical protein
VRKALAILAAVALAACQTTKAQQAPPPDHAIWLRGGQTGEEHVAQDQKCLKESSKARASGTGGGTAYGHPVGLLIGLILVAAIQSARDSNARTEAHNGCMLRAGYLLLEVPEPIANAYRDAEESDRPAVIDNYLLSNDFKPVAEFFTTSETDTIPAYRDYLVRYPDTRFASAIQKRIAQIQAVENRIPIAREGTALLDLANPTLRGLSEDGWVLNGDALDCGTNAPLDILAVIDGGLLDGVIITSSGHRHMLTGKLLEGDRLLVLADWPADNPLRFDTSLHDTLVRFDGRASTASGKDCNQFIWFTQGDASAEPKDLSEMNTMVPSMAPEAWLGRPLRSKNDILTAFQEMNTDG